MLVPVLAALARFAGTLTAASRDDIGEATMGVNLFLTLDDWDHQRLAAEARARGTSLEEHMRKLLATYIGHRYEPLTPDDIINDDRLHLMLDLRTCTRI